MRLEILIDWQGGRWQQGWDLKGKWIESEKIVRVGLRSEMMLELKVLILTP